MAARDREGVFRGGCINHPMHRFGACQKFILMDGTSNCRSCGCVARSHVSIYLFIFICPGRSWCLVSILA